MEQTQNPEILQEKLGFFGKSPQIEELLQTILMVAPTDLSVLITGESGTGKEVVANAIHRLSKRKDKPLISVNCGAIPEGILESELFGHEKGSFTGAIAQRKGYFEAADGGTIFLDEIGEMPLNTQVKLLRVLETSEIMRVGGSKSIKVDVRVIAATNKNLEEAVRNNEFRRDLYFRLKAITLQIPPLRKRKEDIPILVKKFSDEFVRKNQIYFKGFAPEAIELLKQYDWPGNVRELKNFVETAIILNRGEIIHSSYVRSVLNLNQHSATQEFLPVPLNKSPDQAERELIYRTLISLKLDITEIKQMLARLIQAQMDLVQNKVIFPADSPIPQDDSKEVKPTSMSAMERELIKETLKKFNGNRRKTAKALQISERTLYRKLNEYGLS
ncbi:MAG: sigma-54-dependent Fis family transcriptional regulator [Calditrichaeota bacterium]|nr:sigma-54-dependent Fis family transcriptional regulator [Calditrichota bacterium]